MITVTIPLTDHPMPTTPSPLMQRHVLARVTDTLVRRFDGAVAPAEVRATVEQAFADLKADARITTYLPALTEHEATRRLEALTASPTRITGSSTQLSAA